MLKLVDGTELTAEVKEAFKKSVTSAYIKLEDGIILSSRNYLKTLKINPQRQKSYENKLWDDLNIFQYLYNSEVLFC